MFMIGADDACSSACFLSVMIYDIYTYDYDLFDLLRNGTLPAIMIFTGLQIA